MSSIDELNNEENKICHHNLRKNRKPRNYDFEYYEDAINNPRRRRRGKKRGRKPHSVLATKLNSMKLEDDKTQYIRRRQKESITFEQNDLEQNRSNEYLINNNFFISEKTINDQPPKRRGRKRKNFNLLNTNIPLRNNNIKIDRICEYLSYNTNTTWKYMGSTVKFRLINDQQEKYIFLKNMKKHIIFEIIKIAMFALLKININDNNIYSLNDIANKKNDNNQIFQNENVIINSIGENGNKITQNLNCNNYMPKSKNINEDCNDNKNNINSELPETSGSDNSQIYINNVSNNHRKNSIDNNENSIENSDVEKNVVAFGHINYNNSKQEIIKRLEDKNDILNQGVTVSEILDFVKEKYEKYYENVKQYIVTTLNIYCALNMFKLIRRGRYTICKYINFNIFKIKYFKKYYKFFYTLKGEEEVLMNIKNYLKSFYYDKTKNELIGNSNNSRSRANSYNKNSNDINWDGQIIIKRTRKRRSKNLSVPNNEIPLKKECIEQSTTLIDSKDSVQNIKEEAASGDNTHLAGSIGTKKEIQINENTSNANPIINEDPTGPVKNTNIVETGSEKQLQVVNENAITKEACGENEEKEVKAPKRTRAPRNSRNSGANKIKHVNINLKNVNIKCFRVAYGIKHFFCSYDTVEKCYDDFEIINISKKYGTLRNSIVNMNLRYNFLYNSKRLLNNYITNNTNANNNYNSTPSMVLSNNNNNNMNLNRDNQKLKHSQYGKKKNNNNENDSTKHEKYNYLNFNISYKTLRKKLICLRHVNTSKREERAHRPRNELKHTKEKLLTINNDNLVQTCSINSNFSNIVSVDGLSSMNFESLCSQKSQ
ncbi:conserved Plasmodium protein, unknown function [Plasmodium berghei]|uniref:Uncharacterized protein n=2 Tax=Plasmodium berghei TaxID=5821 RepID=A0A509AQK4_PLABA|nr:conserved Plasmodium protein, unknown function [Plasmodium berghei ANKA]CXI74985.1 conserved Plasmodium protein, unknown function [Plasmodium berghei]SCM24754.1 conserved Plasmodium protein, unknown function [Plasmodium berghei]SCN27160.1 conserved Plasmodium protein, unknown function [Plasmodium berghei]SCO61698.1 conserved Plasmodium protein, unknown function [Plasmodium berghei]SCO63583.1 conserved Plasmodium protein, unknown function [Plasmodium berghei]|eukprot:XP_034422794.1 conserved Plasmodium protein, unknown function [Plasmodium berghei ANKA]